MCFEGLKQLLKNLSLKRCGKRNALSFRLEDGDLNVYQQLYVNEFSLFS